MSKKEKIIGNLAGYAGMIILIVVFAFGVYSLATGFSFRGDAFAMLAMVCFYECCRLKYIEFRKKEDEEHKKNNQVSKTSKRVITVVSTYDLSTLPMCDITPKERVVEMMQEEMECLFSEDEGYETVEVKVEDF